MDIRYTNPQHEAMIGHLISSRNGCDFEAANTIEQHIRATGDKALIDRLEQILKVI